MKLSKICEEIEYALLQGSLETEVRDIIYDSRKLAPETMFVCMVGAVTDGHKYIPDAIAKGASVIVLEKEEEAAQIPDTITVLKVQSTRLALALMSAALFDHPARKLVTIGLTGTKGKTTTTYMIKKVLEMAGKKVGLIGTIGAMIGEEHLPSKNTTPESYELHRMFAAMVEAGCEYVVMEVSSQGLKLDRTAGILFDYGIFTNIEPDHIGPNEHKDFDDYLRCKSMLLKQCKHGIVNMDADFIDQVLEGHTCDLETFGVNGDYDFKASDINLFTKPGCLCVSYNLSGKMNFSVEIHVPGNFSVYNSLCAIAICSHFTQDIEAIKQGLLDVRVKGRVEIVPVSKRFTLMIDYAHNAMSLESLLTTLKEYHPKRLVCLFGCGGNRSRDRRFEMGEVSGRLADLTIITSDNPRFEEPQAIIDDIKTGIGKTNGKYVEICDRKEAIKYAISHGEVGDVIVLAGKGHEDYQEICGVKHPFDEKVIVSDILDELGR